MTKALQPGCPVRFLASVTDAGEARRALAGGAEVIDAKDPSAGALGALPIAIVRHIVEAVGGARPVSATVGDLPSTSELLVPAVREMAATGVQYVKVGFFSNAGAARDAIAALGRLDLGPVRLVGLLLADRDPDFGLIQSLAAAGFAGAMLDTADKHARALPDVLDRPCLQAFVSEAQAAGLFAGLAGALRVHHIPALSVLGPDLLGFRGALCCGQSRTGALEEAAVRAVARELAAARSPTPRHPVSEAAT